ncbi:hypothetical protein ANN_06921 [Periplaneta americana]|uniref:Uncharacterized protein n=1 Tax=Periplaneta americana TaxID=6978 RepID=A0ABQ8TEZ1_PERAM|nr:hypothetical protein ANN_06921 [Periplaneta americana]
MAGLCEGGNEPPDSLKARVSAIAGRREFSGGATRFSLGRPELVRIVTMLGTVGIGGYCLWNSGSLADRNDSKTPDPTPSSSTSSQSEHLRPLHPSDLEDDDYEYIDAWLWDQKRRIMTLEIIREAQKPLFDDGDDDDDDDYDDDYPGPSSRRGGGRK